MNEKSKNRCAHCGNCTAVCPVYRVTGRETLTARGKLHLLSTGLAAAPSSHFQDIFARCLLCGACENVCSRRLSIRQEIVRARSGFSHLYGRHPLKRTLARIALARPLLLEGLVKAGHSLSRFSLLPEKSGLRLRLGILEKYERPLQAEPEKASRGQVCGELGYSYFSGCFARYIQPSISEATGVLAEYLTASSVTEPREQVCCGLAAWSAGRLGEARELARRNIEVFSSMPGPILTSCASCSSHLQEYPALFGDDPQWREKAEQFSRRVIEFTSFMADRGQEKRLQPASPVAVYYHEPCHLRFDKIRRGRARQFLQNMDTVTLSPPDTGGHCCGQGGLFHLGYPELSARIFSRAYDGCGAGDVDVVLTTCSGCLMHWQAGLADRGSAVRAVHLAVWLRSYLQINS